MIVALRVKGGFKIKKGFKDTLNQLRLNKKHHCVLINDNPITKGMINKVREFITWGEIDEPTLKSLIKKRGRLTGNKRVDMKDKDLDKFVKDILSGKANLADKKIKPVFRLSPPKKGWERGTIKLHYPRGALGYRGKDINDLLKRMI
jgi:large subunit ribosomal protein L30